MTSEGFKDRNKKIEFLEKLIVEKDNNEHAAHRRVKTVEKSLEELKSRSEVQESELKSQIEELTAQAQLQEAERQVLERKMQEEYAGRLGEKEGRLRSL